MLRKLQKWSQSRTDFPRLAELYHLEFNTVGISRSQDVPSAGLIGNQLSENTFLYWPPDLSPCSPSPAASNCANCRPEITIFTVGKNRFRMPGIHTYILQKLFRVDLRAQIAGPAFWEGGGSA